MRERIVGVQEKPFDSCALGSAAEVEMQSELPAKGRDMGMRLGRDILLCLASESRGDAVEIHMIFIASDTS